MPPNAKGGKGYKKGKKVGEEAKAAPLNIDRQEGQMVARALRLLGNRNVLCYCNDDRLRICHICGKMKCGKSRIETRIEAGDMVLISLRDFRTGTAALDGKDRPDRGDIVAKYAHELLSKLKREPGINPKLFSKLETMDGMTLSEIGVDKSKEKILDDDDCGFVIEDTDSEAEEAAAKEREERNEILNRGGAVEGARQRGGRQMAATASMGDDDLDIDAI